MVEEGRREELRLMLNRARPGTLADLIEGLDAGLKLEAFSYLDPELASEVVFELNNSAREFILEEIDEDRIVALLDKMYTDDAADLVNELDEGTRADVLKLLHTHDARYAQQLRSLMRFDADTAGGVMQFELVRVKRGTTAEMAIQACRAMREELDRIYDIYVVDEHERLQGHLRVDQLLFAEAKTTVDALMNEAPLTVNANVHQSELIEIVRREDVPVIAVVDDAGHLLGRITSDDLFDIIDAERGADMLLMVGAGEDERAFDSPIRAVRGRMPWLFAYLCTALLTASVVQLFQGTIEQLAVLAAFMPIVGGMGGNAGTQTLAVAIRGLAVGEIRAGQAFRLIRKEMGVGVLMGLGLGAVIGVIVGVMQGNAWLGVVLGCALIVNSVIAGLAGTIVPILLTKFRIDPALASGVVVTTLTDMCGFVAFLGLATLLLPFLL